MLKNGSFVRNTFMVLFVLLLLIGLFSFNNVNSIVTENFSLDCSGTSVPECDFIPNEVRGSVINAFVVSSYSVDALENVFGFKVVLQKDQLHSYLYYWYQLDDGGFQMDTESIQ